MFEDLSFPAKLRLLRARRGVTVLQASREIPIDRHVLADLERGDKEPSFKYIKRLADYYGIEVDYLLSPEMLEPELAGKAEAPPETVGVEERRNRARVLIPYMDSAAKEGSNLIEDIKASPQFPLRKHNVFAGWCVSLWWAFREVADHGGMFPELEEAFARLSAVREKEADLAGVALGLEAGGDEASRDFRRFARRRAEAQRGGEPTTKGKGASGWAG
jgi:transcriptional regulator with XRE-family HTH domain